MTATRRLAANMAIDVVGHSRLMAEDEAGTARAARKHRGGRGRSWRGSGARPKARTAPRSTSSIASPAIPRTRRD